MFFSLLMEGSYSQMGPVNVCYCLRKAKWLLYISLRSHLNVLPTDEMKEGGKEKGKRGTMHFSTERERRGMKWKMKGEGMPLLPPEAVEAEVD